MKKRNKKSISTEMKELILVLNRIADALEKEIMVTNTKFSPLVEWPIHPDLSKFHPHDQPKITD